MKAGFLKCLDTIESTNFIHATNPCNFAQCIYYSSEDHCETLLGTKRSHFKCLVTTLSYILADWFTAQSTYIN